MDFSRAARRDTSTTGDRPFFSGRLVMDAPPFFAPAHEEAARDEPGEQAPGLRRRSA